MKTHAIFRPIKIQWMLTFLVMTACVDPVFFEAPPAQSLYVVEGMISTEAGPYSVTISKGFALSADTSYSAPVESAQVTLYDDAGNTEAFVETSPGKYLSQGVIQGQFGRSYHIRIITSEGKVFESTPDKLHEVGEIQDIRYEFEARVVQEDFGEIPADVFKIFVDATAGKSDEQYVRWRFTGTYEVETSPELHMIHVPPYTPYKAPFPCSGYVVGPGPPFSGGLLKSGRL
jgi:hypothetical protein